jgi:DNA invertase Pin-like site-specific DNA recombinase
VAAKTDRLSRSMPGLYDLMDRSQRGRWTMLTADGFTDTSTREGRMMAAVAGLFAEYERELIAQRTKDALAAKKAAGVRLGRPVKEGTEALRMRVRVLHREGMSAPAVAAALNAEGLRTPTGLEWNAKRVHRMLDSLRVDDDANRAALL